MNISASDILLICNFIDYFIVGMYLNRIDVCFEIYQHIYLQGSVDKKLNNVLLSSNFEYFFIICLKRRK